MIILAEQKSINPDFSYEQKLWRQGYDFVVGLDEVGRGPLAGPVVAAAVLICHPGLDPGSRPWSPAFPPSPMATEGRGARRTEKRLQIRDSKKLSANQRERWFEILAASPDIKYGIGIVSEKIIDRINILEATKLAMKRALVDLKGEPDYLLLDGNFLLEDLSVSQKAVTRGDEKIWSCAAASIIAKVTRDRLMLKYHAKFPQYGFDSHKGYGTRAHMAAIGQYGACSIHRRSFVPCKKESFDG
ncbi:MAG: ribonuclease HII [Candidatus Portnoybacteria bacterium]|nr:ribonuclease HII [Candidatus Portnoybacteria bacterium]MDD4982929.1 ribonuclease HII [Candidatus Portnoybacteria bacterium]